jgi:hypothetical protein
MGDKVRCGGNWTQRYEPRREIVVVKNGVYLKRGLIGVHSRIYVVGRLSRRR